MRTVLTDLLHTSCQYLYPIDNIVTSNNFDHCHMRTLHDFSSGKVRFIYTSTVTRSHSCYGKKYAYASRTSCYIKNDYFLNYFFGQNFSKILSKTHQIAQGRQTEFWMGGLNTCQPPLILRKIFYGGWLPLN